jgi:hypothetical protein
VIFKEKHLGSPTIIEHGQSSNTQLLITLDTNYLTCRGIQVQIAPYLSHLPFSTLRLYRITQETTGLHLDRAFGVRPEIGWITIMHQPVSVAFESNLKLKLAVADH